MLKKRNVLLICAVTFLVNSLISCQTGKPDAIARSYNAYLYPDELQGVVPPGVSGDDSLQLVRAYIEQWVRQQALLHHAQRNVNINFEQLERQVEEYRNGLIVYQYEQALVSQKLDTVVTEEEIQDYYRTREELFTLKQPIFKLSFIRLRTDAPELDRVRRWFSSTDFEDRDLLEKYCALYASSYQLHDTAWHYMADLGEHIPFARLDERDYNKTGRIFEIVENNELYLIILHDSKFSNSRSPLALEYENIRNLILNRRKVDLIEEMQKLIVDDARNKNNIEIYN